MLDLIINPLVTLLLLLYHLLGENVFLAIVALSVLIRGALIPLNLRQYRSMKAMQDVQPELKKLQEKYKNEREVLAQKQMELFREKGVNPLAGCWPILIQFPIWIALLRAITGTLASTPNEMLHLSDRLLISIPGLDFSSLIPLNNQFLWLNLALPDQYLVLPVLVVATSWVQQKMLMPPAPRKKRTGEEKREDDPTEQAAQMTRQMTTYMPLMLGFFALSYSSGLSIYFILSNIIGIIQYTALGRASIGRLFGREPLTDDQKLELETRGRIRKNGISDTRKREGRVLFELAEGETRSKRVTKAWSNAKRAKPE